ncbi:putative transporter small subunit [Micrococcoides hystricis]|uniref:Transporter small subunit n=1 Tax=Micrococcoides hystricis TaxID=1572761 RepID=A0ABV6PAI9_9MICC
MTTFFLTVYVLMWPVIVAGVLFIIARAFFKELREARERGEQII